MSGQFIGEIKLVGFNFAARGYSLANGTILSIAQNSALFSLLGTTYGGNGTSTFALPNLGGRTPIGQGQSPGTSNYVIGEVAGTESTSLTINNMPMHNHTALATTTILADQSSGNLSANPVGNWITVGQTGGATPAPMKQFTTLPDPNPPTGTMAAGTAATAVTIGIAGGSQPFGILQPFLALNYIIALEGIFPSRN